MTMSRSRTGGAGDEDDDPEADPATGVDAETDAEAYGWWFCAETCGFANGRGREGDESGRRDRKGEGEVEER